MRTNEFNSRRLRIHIVLGYRGAYIFRKSWTKPIIISKTIHIESKS